MDLIQVIILALLQGITEFLPVSSSAHLILPAQLWSWDDQGLAFDVAVHLGSLSAVIIYFRKDLWQLTLGSQKALLERRATPESKMVALLALATVPAVIFGAFASATGLMDDMRSILVIASTTLVFGVLLGFADRFRGAANEKDMGWRGALIIGLAQAVAIIPGTSRSGATITAALMLGYSREAAARFSFLLSIPIILAAGSLLTLKLVQQGQGVDWYMLLVGTVLSGISAWLCIKLFLSAIGRMGMMPFVIYRLLLAAVLFYIYFNL